MARRVRAADLETRSARLRLPVAKKPIFAKVGLGIGLGYRRNATAGTWVTRVANGKGGNWTKAIGAADDFADADGENILDFWQAQDRARAMARRESNVASGPMATIAKALTDYEADLKIRNGDAGNVTRVRAHLSGALAKTSIAFVTTRELRHWRDQLADDLVPATVNRTTNALKAALNLAADNDERITNRRAWEIGLASIQDAEELRNVILPEADIRMLIAKADEQSGLFRHGARAVHAARRCIRDVAGVLPHDRAPPEYRHPVEWAARAGARMVSAAA